MGSTKTGANRLKGGLQPGWSLSHKTGTGQVLGSVQAGYNDIGILTAPDGRSYAVAVMIKKTSVPLPTRMFTVRTVGTLLLALSVALAVALATHSSVDPSFSTAAGGPPVNWVGTPGAYASDLLLMLFGPAAALFLPGLALAGLRMMRGDGAGRLGRSLLVTTIGILLAGIALAMIRDTAVSGLPAGWGGALGFAGAHTIDAGVKLIGNPNIAGPLRMCRRTSGKRSRKAGHLAAAS